VEEVLDASLDHPTTGHATVASLRAAGDFVPLRVPAIAYAERKFDSPSGKVEFYSSQTEKLGLSPLPVHKADQSSPYPLALSFGRTLTQFHAFYNEGRALPSLAKHNAAPQLWDASQCGKPMRRAHSSCKDRHEAAGNNVDCGFGDRLAACLISSGKMEAGYRLGVT
jgi:hypothetical protein